MRPQAQCGTESGYKRHRRYNETICEPCRIAHNKASRRRRPLRDVQHHDVPYEGGWYRDGLIWRPTAPRQPEATNEPPPLPAVPCGTEQGYQRHRHTNDTATDDRRVTCEPCLEAHRTVQRVKAARKRKDAA